jgi:hypothetical protein
MTTAKDVGSIILLVLLSPLALIALLLGALFGIPVYIIGVIVAFARHDELLGWTRIKVALAWPLEFWLKLKTKKAFAFLGRQVGRLSGRLKKWNAGRIRRTEGKLASKTNTSSPNH